MRFTSSELRMWVNETTITGEVEKKMILIVGFCNNFRHCLIILKVLSSTFN